MTYKKTTGITLCLINDYICKYKRLFLKRKLFVCKFYNEREFDEL